MHISTSAILLGSSIIIEDNNFIDLLMPYVDEDCNMLFQSILILMVLQGVHPSYLYNPYTHKILTLLSLSNVPVGYKLIPPPYERRSSMRGGNHIGQCSDPGFICDKPYDSSLTYQFHCSKDSQCPKFFKCCRHRCFSHRICVKAIMQSIDTGRNQHTLSPQRPGTCEKWPYNCQIPYHRSITSMFKCDNDRQCPRAYKCCQQSCFEHRICSKAIAYNAGYVEELRQKENETTQITTSRKTQNDFTALSSTTIENSRSTENEEETTETFETTHSEESESEKSSEMPTSESTDDDYSDSTTEITSVTADGESTTVIETETISETRSETIMPKSSTSTNDLEESTEVATEIGYISSSTTESKDGSTREVVHISVRRSTPDPNAIVPEYSEFYYYYDNQNDTEYDTES